MIERYFDHAATTPLDPRVLEAMLPYLGSSFGNANSPHQLGREARDAVENARAQLAFALSSDAYEVAPEQLIFTSGASEANNWILRSFDSIAISPFEHSSLYETALALGKDVLENDEHELFSPANHLELASVMTVNNETGATYDVRQVENVENRHADITQSAAKYETDLSGIDFASLSAHKFNGPKGVGALFTASGSMPPLLIGGEQEHGYRAGTLNVPGIVGMGVAAKLSIENREESLEKVKAARDAFLNALKLDENVRINSPVDGPNASAPHILSVSYRWLEGESIVIEADAAGFAISSGAACSTGSNEPSHVLTALGLEPEWIRGTVRVSFGSTSQPTFAEELARTMNLVAQSLRQLSR